MATEEYIYKAVCDFKFIPGSSEVISNGDVVERHVTRGGGMC